MRKFADRPVSLYKMLHYDVVLTTNPSALNSAITVSRLELRGIYFAVTGVVALCIWIYCAPLILRREYFMPSMLRLICLRPAVVLSLSALVAALSSSQSAQAADLPMDQSITRGMGDDTQPDHHMGNHSAIPAGVYGGNMVDSGKFMFNYVPMLMRMTDNYIGSITISPQVIATTIPSQVKMPGGAQEMYRVVPTSMDVQSHMFHFMYGVSGNFNLMAMLSYQKKSMNMLTFSGATGTTVRGSSSASTSGFGDTTVGALWRIYQNQASDAHLHLGLSLPTGSTTQNVTMLSPMPGTMNMTARGSYGMQLGTGTYDLLPGLTFTRHTNNWSWGTAWRSRIPVGNNSEGYRYGDLHELTGWGGYSTAPGVTVSARITESVQGAIRGSDPMISGLMEGSNPNFYGGRRTDVFGGVEIAGAPFGYKNKHLSLEAGKTLLQNLNGPQLGRAWTFTAALGIGF